MQVSHENLESAFWRILEDGEEPLQVVCSLPGTIPSSTLPRLSQQAPHFQEPQQGLLGPRNGRRRRANFSALQLPHSATRHTSQHQTSPPGASPAEALGITGVPADLIQHADRTVAGSTDDAAAAAAVMHAVHDCGKGSMPSSEPVTAAGAAADRAAGPMADTAKPAEAIAEVRAGPATVGSSACASGAPSEVPGDQEADRIGLTAGGLEEPSSMQLESDESSSDADEGIFGIARAPPWHLTQIPRMLGSLLRYLHPSQDLPGLASAQVSLLLLTLDVQQCRTLWGACMRPDCRHQVAASITRCLQATAWNDWCSAGVHVHGFSQRSYCHVQMVQ